MFGYIYKISCKDPKIKDYYIGSTNNYKRRKQQHIYCSKNVFDNHNNLYDYIRNNGTINNFQFDILLKVSVNEKKDLLEIEKQFIKSSKNLLNKCIPNRTQKEYYIDNQEIIKEKRLVNYNKNKAKILFKKSSIMVTCTCGITLTKNHIHRHYKSKKHLNYLITCKSETLTNM